MIIAETIKEVRAQVKAWKKEGLTVGLVPTMGYLHEGHMSLVQAAKEQCDKVVISIFVNPMQFGKSEDLSTYPRDFEKDSAYCQAEGVDLIFHPEAEEMYTPGFSTFVDMNVLTEDLCGASRPVMFRGVCTVCSKLFHIVQPDKAFFGEKDAQQLAVIKRMVEDLNMDLEIVGCPTVREEDGLAKSSRNAYMDSVERQAALCVYRAVVKGQELCKSGETDTSVITDAMKNTIEEEPMAVIDYVKIVDALTMQPVEVIDRPVVAAIAIFLNGKVRLIDNFSFTPEEK